MKSTYIQQQKCGILQETLGMRATYMEEGILENAALILDEPELEAMVIGSANTNATISEIEV